MAASVMLAETVYDVSCNVILDSAMRAIAAWDVVTSMIKCWVFGTIISAGGCSLSYCWVLLALAGGCSVMAVAGCRAGHQSVLLR